MRRTTLVSSMLGIAALLASASGCGEWKAIVDKAHDFGAGAKTGTTDGTGTGAGGMSGGVPDACTQITEGGDTSCKDSGTWKMYGAATCDARKMVLTDLKFGVSCAPDRYQTATYFCCPAPTGTGGTGAPPPDPIKCGVTTDAYGQPCKTCWDATGVVVRSECAPSPTGAGGSGATPICDVSTDANGNVCKTCWDVTGMVVAGDCAPSPTGAGGSGAPPPDPIKCDVTTNASGQQCKTCWDATGMVVANDCAPAPTTGAGGSGAPPAGTCSNIIDGGPSSCKDPATWKMYGIARCTAEKLVLTNVLTLTTCASGIESVAYVCCAP
jgi:hypothetical protein